MRPSGIQLVFLTGKYSNAYLRHVEENRNLASSGLVIRSIEVSKDNEEFFEAIDNEIHLFDEVSTEEEPTSSYVPIPDELPEYTPPPPEAFNFNQSKEISTEEELDIFKDLPKTNTNPQPVPLKPSPVKTPNQAKTSEQEKQLALIKELQRQSGMTYDEVNNEIVSAPNETHENINAIINISEENQDKTKVSTDQSYIQPEAHQNKEIIEIQESSASLSEMSEEDEQSIKPQLLSNELNTNSSFPLTYSSYALGKMGEYEIYEMFRRTFPKFETTLTNDVSHAGDIQVHDPISEITYLVEVKNKKTLTANDITKFEDDITRLKSTAAKVVGIFLSLNSPIPKYGEMAVDLGHVYLSQHYVTPECIELAIDMFSKIVGDRMEGGSGQAVQYEIPKNVYTLVGQLQLQYHSLQRDKEDCELQIDQNGKSTQRMIAMLARIQLKLEFISFLNKEFKDVTERQEVSMIEIEETKLRNYLAMHSNPRKKDLIEMFPMLATRLQALTLTNIKLQFCPGKMAK